MVFDQKLFKSLGFILNESQDGVAAHQKLIQKCLKLYEESDPDDFFETFTNVIQPMLIVMQKNPNIDRCVEFIAKFCASLSPIKDSDGSQMELEHTQSEITNNFLISLINHLIGINRANCDAVRYRVCHILSRLMSVISNDQSIDEELYDSLCDAMLERLKDINSRVQVQAISAIYRLQDPNDRECRVIKALLFLMAYDPHWQVRFQSLSNIAFSKQTLPEIIDRVKDPHPQVRRKAILILSEKVLIKFISIEKRLLILNYALKDQDQSVVDACSKKLIPSWLAFKENDVCKLLKALDVVDSSSTCEIMLDKMFADNSIETICKEFSHSLNEKQVISLEKLDAESIFYWHWVCSKCKQLDDTKNGDRTQTGDGQDQLDSLLPSLTEYCSYVDEAFEKIERDRLEKDNDDRFQLESIFVLKKLVELFKYTDFSDAHGKKCLNTLCHKLFSNKNYAIIYETLMQIYKMLHPNLQTRINNLVELISDLKDNRHNEIGDKPLDETIQNANNDSSISPQEIQFKISELKFKRFSLKDDFDKLYNEFKNVNKTVDMNRLNEIRNQIKEVEDEIADLQAKLVDAPSKQSNTNAITDPNQNESVRVNDDPIEIDFHCLNIAICLLEDQALKSLTPQIRSLCDSLIIPNISSVNEELRSLSVCALGLACILKLEMAQKYVPLFLEVIQRDKKEIVIEAFKAMINCIMAFSVKRLVSADDDMDNMEATGKIMSVMTSLLDHEESDVYTLAVEGFCKLYMTGHILSAKLFSKLLIMYYSPLTENDVKLRSFLSAFLPQFSFFRANNQLCVEESFMITLKCLINAPADSYLSSIDLIKVMETLFNLINPKNLIHKNHTNMCHEEVVKLICYEMLKDDNSYKCKTYLKVLQMADLTEADYLSLKNIHQLSQEVYEHIEDKLVKKMAKKFEENVLGLLCKKPEHQHLLDQSKQTEPVREQDAEKTIQNDSLSSEIIDHEFPKIIKKTSKTNKTLTRTLNETNKTICDRTQVSRRSSPRITRVSANESVLSNHNLKEAKVVIDKLDESVLSKVDQSRFSTNTLVETEFSANDSEQENKRSKKLKVDTRPVGSLKRVTRNSRSKSQTTSQDEEPPSKIARDAKSKKTAPERRTLRSRSAKTNDSSKLVVDGDSNRASSNSTRELRRSSRNVN